MSDRLPYDQLVHHLSHNGYGLAELLHLLRRALGDPDADFRQGQVEAIEAALKPPYRALVVQATGWGKSMVYFIATKVLRDQGRGPTLVVSLIDDMVDSGWTFTIIGALLRNAGAGAVVPVADVHQDQRGR